jgi:ubiquinone/menaquinone biosynthesis C-methylase UbiE
MEKVPPDYRTINRKTYDLICKSWEEKRDYVWEPVEKFLKGKGNSAEALLDIGCGNGRHMQLAVKCRYKDIIGCDFSESQLKTCKAKGFNAVRCDMTNLPFPDGSFDKVLCIATVHHLLERQDQKKALAEMKRVLKGHGQVLVSVWIPQKGYLRKQIEKKKFRFLDREKKLAKITYMILKDNRRYDRYYYMFRSFHPAAYLKLS